MNPVNHVVIYMINQVLYVLNILGRFNQPNLCQAIMAELKQQGTPCRSIRCREVKGNDEAIARAELIVRIYEANDGL